MYFTKRGTPKRQMKETQYTRHRNTVEPMMVAKDMKATLHTDAINKAVENHEINSVLDGRPPPISNSEKDHLTRKERTIDSRSTNIRILWSPGLLQEQNQESYKPHVCADCGMTPHDVKHLFIFPAHPTTLTNSDL